MNHLIVVFLLNFVHYSIQATPQTPQEIDAAIKECTASTSVNPQILEKLYTKGEFTDDPNLKCFIKCLAVKMGGMTESGELLVDDVKGRFATAGVPADKTSKIVDTCKDVKGADPCDTAFNVAKCMMDETMKAQTN